MYHFSQNNNIGKADIVNNMFLNCQNCVEDKSVLCIQDTSEVNLYNHRNRIKKDEYIGLNGSLGFLIHPSFVLDSETFTPYGFSDVKIWNRTYLDPKKDHSHQKNYLYEQKPIKFFKENKNSLNIFLSKLYKETIQLKFAIQK